MTRSWRPRRWKLRTKIALLVLASAFLPLAVAQTLTFLRARAITEERYAVALAARATQLAAEVDRFNAVYLGTARRLARLSQTARVLRARDADGLASVRDTLRALPETDDGILAAQIVDGTGRIVAASDPRSEGLDVSFRPFVGTAIGGNDAISDPFMLLPSAGGLAVVAFASPVFEAGRTDGAVVVLVRANTFWNEVRDASDRAGNGAFTVVLDRFGLRIAHTLREDFVFHPAGRLDPSLTAALERERRFGDRTRALLESPIEWPELMRLGTSMTPPTNGALRLVAPRDGAAYLAQARRLSSAPWTLVHFVPLAAVQAPAREVASTLLQGSVVSLLLILAAVALAERVARPAEELSTAVDALARGEDAQVAVRGSDELAHLAGRFNEMAAAVRSAREGLETRVRERTEELLRANAHLESRQRELVASREELERQRRALVDTNEAVQRADRRKSEFLANMSHELRTPLNAIIGFSDLLAEQAGARLSEAEARYLHDVRASGRHLLQLINDTLDLSKIEAGRLTLEPDVVEPGLAASEAASFVRPAAASKRVEIRVDADGAPPVRADPRRLRQVLLNLLSNAVKFSPEGAAVDVRATAERGCVRFAVRDRGPGIEPELRPRLFEPFAQGESPLAKTQQGAGLGLAISRRLVELHGGALEVDSVAGEGATFSFTLPLATAPGAPTAEPRAALLS